MRPRYCFYRTNRDKVSEWNCGICDTSRRLAKRNISALAALRLRVARPALSRQIQDLEREIGFKLFDRLSRGVKISSAGRLFLEEARRILQQLNEATERAQRVARGQSGTLRVGFTENASWRGVVPDSLHLFRERYPDAELQLNPLPSLQQLEAVRSGRLDAGFMFNPPKPDRELDQLPAAVNSLALRLLPRTRSGRSSTSGCAT